MPCTLLFQVDKREEVLAKMSSISEHGYEGPVTLVVNWLLYADRSIYRLCGSDLGCKPQAHIP